MILVFACALLSVEAGSSQTTPSVTTVSTVPVPSADIVPVQPASIVLVQQDTPVELMVMTEVSTATATPGTIFKLRVNKPVVIDGRTVFPVGTLAFGKVTTAVDSGGLGKSGQMAAKLLHIQLGDAEIPLEGETSAKGQGAGNAGVAVLFGGILGLFHRGNNAKIKAGELLVGYVSSDYPVDFSGLRPKRATPVVGLGAATDVHTK